MVDGCLASLLSFFRKSHPNADYDGYKKPLFAERKEADYPYKLQEYFLSYVEASFYRQLKAVIADRAVIFAKVRLWDIFYIPLLKKDRNAKRILGGRHVDFLLCHPHSLNPVVAIELDDSSHQRPERQERDKEVDRVFEAAGLPLLHIGVERKYDPDELLHLLDPYLPARRPEQTPISVTIDPDNAPLCPKCGGPMVVKFARQGAFQGQPFYSCTNYPNCKGMIPIKVQS